MRIASRHMPKLQPRDAGLVGWLFLALIGAIALYIAISAPKPFFAVMAVLLVLCAMAHLQGKRDQRKLLALAATRTGQTICEFTRDFDARAVDTWIIRAVYEQLQGQLNHIHPAFPVRADDRLKEDLFLDDDDLDMELAQDVEARTGRTLDGSANNPYSGKVVTVRDFVLFFQSQPRASRST